MSAGTDDPLSFACSRCDLFLSSRQVRSRGRGRSHDVISGARARDRLLWQPATGKRFWARKMANFVKLWEARQAVMEELFAAAV